jgi:ferritin
MNEEWCSLLDESIHLELNVADLYEVFHIAFPDDADFWWTLLLEEKNHAALLRSAKEAFMPLDKFPRDLVLHSLEELKHANATLVTLIRKCRDAHPSREEAFNIAVTLEQSAGEIHFQQFVDRKANSKIDDIFQQLNKDDKDHAMRIRSYMENHGIKLITALRPRS